MTTTAPREPDFQRLMLAALECGDVFVHFDPRRHSGRVLMQCPMVPAHFAAQPSLTLQFGYDLANPIRDLQVTRHGVSGIMSFNRTPQSVFVPWCAVYALTDARGEGTLWPERVPPEVTFFGSPQSPAAAPTPHVGATDNVIDFVTAASRIRAKRNVGGWHPSGSAA
jgi:hypothetical protein